MLLVKLLALWPNNRVHREELLELMWPELDPDLSANNLYKTLHAARRALEPTLQPGARSRFIELRRQQIVLVAPGTLEIDADEFERCALEALATPRVESCEAALSLYVGDLLLEDRFEDLFVARRERLRDLRRRVALALGELLVGAGEQARAVELLERLVAEDACDEEAHRALMRAYTLAGRRGDAIEQFRRCVAALGRELDVAPDPETVALHERLRCDAAPQSRSSLPEGESHEAAVRVSLPATRFIGRRDDMRLLAELIVANRVVTVTGMGGVGKTRIALETSRRADLTFSGGAFVVDVAPLGDAEQIARTGLAALDVACAPTRGAVDTLVDALRDREALVLLDNCETALVACSSVIRDLVANCRGVRVLATSREPIGVEGEAVLNLAPLALPVADSTDLGEVLASESASLLVDRLRLVDPRLEIEPRHAATIASLCRRLEGIPLAIELAASRFKVFTLGELDARLTERLAFLAAVGPTTAPERHRTLRATLEWSHALLTESERRLFRRLSVFRGGASLAAVESACAGDGSDALSIVDALSRLADKSFVVVARGGAEARYSMLETVREYASHELERSGEAVRVRAAHRDWYLALVERAAQTLATAASGEWLERLEIESANVRAAFEWSSESRGGASSQLRIAAAMTPFWVARGYVSEGRSWVESALSRSGRTAARDRLRALGAGARLATSLGRHAEAREYAARCLRTARRMGDRDGIAIALFLLAQSESLRGRYDVAHTWSEKALAAARVTADRHRIAMALNGMGVSLRYLGDNFGAAERYSESIAIFRELGDEPRIGNALNSLGEVLVALGDDAAAEACLEESLGVARRLGMRQATVRTMNTLGVLWLARGDLDRAAAIAEESLAIASETPDAYALMTTRLLLGRVGRRAGDTANALVHLDAVRRGCESMGFDSLLIDALLESSRVECATGDLAAAAADAERLVEIAVEIGEWSGVAQGLEVLACVLAAGGDARGAFELLGAAGPELDAARLDFPAGDPDFAKPYIDRAYETLGPVAARSAIEAGRSLSVPQALGRLHQTARRAGRR